jgi:hypothetical protein
VQAAPLQKKRKREGARWNGTHHEQALELLAPVSAPNKAIHDLCIKSDATIAFQKNIVKPA